eukprot:1604926-Prymnesium_polylepis.1
MDLQVKARMGRTTPKHFRCPATLRRLPAMRASILRHTSAEVMTPALKSLGVVDSVIDGRTQVVLVRAF